MKISVLFPGQGAQFRGMGKDLYDTERVVQDLFEEAADCLGINFVELCFSMSDASLRDPVYAQTSVFLTSMALLSVMKERVPQLKPTAYAGHSSGIYTALCAGGGLSFADTLYLLKKRAEFMKATVLGQKGKMSAIIGLEAQVVQELCNQYDVPTSNNQVVQVANYNSRLQVVISGTNNEVDSVVRAAEKLGAREVPLRVAGAYHSRMMGEAEQLFRQYLYKIDVQNLHTPVVGNQFADYITTAQEVQTELHTHMTAPVRWDQTIARLRDSSLFIQCGPGNALHKMIVRDWPELASVGIASDAEFDQLADFGFHIVRSVRPYDEDITVEELPSVAPRLDKVHDEIFEVHVGRDRVPSSKDDE